MIGSEIRNLVDPMISRAASQPDRIMCHFYQEDGTHQPITNRQFFDESCCFAAALQQNGLQAGDLVIVVLKHSRELLSAFWGSLLLGAIPSIFPYLTEKLDRKIYSERIRLLVEHSQAKAIITFADFLPELRTLLKDVNCKILCIEDILNNDNPSSSFVSDIQSISSESTAFLQHSSGTTGLQKGVMLSHAAVINQIRAYSKAIQLSHHDQIISWLPLYHDMGLIAGFVMPITAGIPLILLSPFHWVRDPKILFQYITLHKATIAWLPNFAYNHLVRGIRKREIESFDLSSIRAFINCSEPVRWDSHQQFYERFASTGLTETSLHTCYAMAENTFAVTQSDLSTSPRIDWIQISALQREGIAVPGEMIGQGIQGVVSNGKPIDGTEVKIVNARGNDLPERHAGEIVLRGNSMLSGYYRRPDATEESIIDSWYHTGDIGYMAEGELYISGRKKDLIISGGKNIFPQDLEAIASTVHGIHPGRVVAFGIDDNRLGSEAIVMVCELTDESVDLIKKQEIENDLRTRVAKETEVTLHDVMLVPKRWVIKTSSGKTARSANRDKYILERNNNSNIPE